jgi:ribosomal protein S18 acetylase RimI-like enzyme
MITYTDTCVGVHPEQLCGFFEGWPNPPTPETHLRILRASSHLVLAVESSRQVVGFVTAISDGVLFAYISLLEVLPSHRRRGIGSHLMRRLIERLRGIYAMNLHCDPQLRPFYESLGMHSIPGMAIVDYSAQAGTDST